jgi:hypothetical protein
LNAIDYKEDKELFIADFLQNVQLQSLQNLLQTLPADKLQNIKLQLLASTNDQNKITEILKTSFSQDQIQHAIENAAKEGVSSYIKVIDDLLSDAQRDNLIKVLEKYSSTQPTTSNP